MTEKRVASNGLSFRVIDEGEGPAVVLLHGFPDTASLWRHQIPALVDAGFRVVAPDLRGFGASDTPEAVEDYVLFNSVADVRGILDELGIERAHIVGHDWGAGVGWVVAMAEPTRVDRLAAISVGHPGAFTRPILEQMRASWYVFVFQAVGIAEELFSRDGWRLFRAWLDSHPDADEVIERMSAPGAFTAGVNWYRASMRPEVWGLDLPYPEIAAPVMGVWGSTDAFLTEPQMTDSVQYLTGPWRYERMEGAGHWIPLERPAELNDLLLGFLRDGRQR